MPSTGQRKVSSAVQPKPEDYSFDLDHALQSVVGLRAVIPADAFTAQTLGTERAGHGVLIGDRGLVLTVGYLITEAQEIWLHLADGRAVPGHALATDAVTGFGLVQALSPIDVPSLPLGNSTSVETGDRVIVAGAGGRIRSVAARIAAKQEFAGYWEYVLEEAIFTAPSHPNWGGTAVIGPDGSLLGIGSLQLEASGGKDINMVIPIDLLKPVLEDLVKTGSRPGPVRPWLGLYVADSEDRLVVMGLAEKGPAHEAELETGDVILAVDNMSVGGLSDLFRKIWSLGHAGAEVPITVERDGQTIEVVVKSGDRQSFLKTPRLH
jgi:S1-C subfamily serine protease